jgi:hypothetical protein
VTSGDELAGTLKEASMDVFRGTLIEFSLTEGDNLSLSPLLKIENGESRIDWR